VADEKVLMVSTFNAESIGYEKGVYTLLGWQCLSRRKADLPSLPQADSNARWLHKAEWQCGSSRPSHSRLESKESVYRGS
jgi:hypothetical protein